MKNVIHFLLTIIWLIIGILFISFSQIKAISDITWIRNITNTVGTSLLIFGILELVFKRTLQKYLIDEIKIEVNKCLNVPFPKIYLMRHQMPPEDHIIGLLNRANKEIIIKSFANSQVIFDGLKKEIENALIYKPKLKMKFLLFDIKNSRDNERARLLSFANLQNVEVEDQIEGFLNFIEKQKTKYKNQIECVLYNSLPTSNIIMVDGNKPYGFCKIEFYLYSGQPAKDRINVFLEKGKHGKYFEAIYNALTDELCEK